MNEKKNCREEKKGLNLSCKEENRKGKQSRKREKNR